MSVPRKEIIAEAKQWLGTPYRHQASCKGAGADCLGLLRGVWRTVYGQEPEPVPAYSADWSEPQGEEALWAAAARHLSDKAIAERATGDVLLFRMRSGAVAKHLGLFLWSKDRPHFLHAYSGQGVVLSPLSDPWARRVVACFEFPERKN